VRLQQREEGGRRPAGNVVAREAGEHGRRHAKP
jgi:hypothetical protein